MANVVEKIVLITLRRVGYNDREVMKLASAVEFQSPCGEQAATSLQRIPKSIIWFQSPYGDWAATYMVE